MMEITLEQIEKLIEREQIFIDDAYEKRDVDYHKWHRAKQRAFEEIVKLIKS